MFSFWLRENRFDVTQGVKFLYFPIFSYFSQHTPIFPTFQQFTPIIPIF